MTGARLAQAVEQLLPRGEQAILFLNRRGYSTFVLCKACGNVLRCDQCSVSLTYHRGEHALVCHYCGHKTRLPTACPRCRAEALERLGLGTERVEQELAGRFPDARIARLDRDTAAGRGLRRILDRVGRREVDILVGTQMVTKGHDFPHVTLVGVLGADLGLNFPDFRAAERTFQLLTQVAGRAGRGARPGRVLVQTYSPEHPAIQCARSHDYLGYFDSEVGARRELGYPPFGFLAAVRVDGPDAAAVERRIRQLARQGHRAQRDDLGVGILGPTEAPIQRLKGRTRWLLLMRAPARERLRRVLGAVIGPAGEAVGEEQGLRVSVDVDPLMMM